MVAKSRINGCLLAHYIEKEVILLGIITNKSTSGKSLQITTTDGVPVNVTLPNPITDNAEGYIEIHGTVQSKSTMNCDYYILFPSDVSQDFDSDQYNEIIALNHAMGSRHCNMFFQQMK